MMQWQRSSELLRAISYVVLTYQVCVFLPSGNLVKLDLHKRVESCCKTPETVKAGAPWRRCAFAYATSRGVSDSPTKRASGAGRGEQTRQLSASACSRWSLRMRAPDVTASEREAICELGVWLAALKINFQTPKGGIIIVSFSICWATSKAGLSNWRLAGRMRPTGSFSAARNCFEKFYYTNKIQYNSTIHLLFI